MEKWNLWEKLTYTQGPLWMRGRSRQEKPRSSLTDTSSMRGTETFVFTNSFFSRSQITGFADEINREVEFKWSSQRKIKILGFRDKDCLKAAPMCQDVSFPFLVLPWTPDSVKFISPQSPFSLCLMRLLVAKGGIDIQLCTACIHLPEKGHGTRKDCQGQPWWNFWESGGIPSSGRKPQGFQRMEAW